MQHAQDLLWTSISSLEKWVEAHEYRGYEPFDGLSSALRPLTFGNLFAERVLQQTVRRSVVNLRPLLGIKPQESTKGRGYMAWGYTHMWKLTGNPEYRSKAEECLDWLAAHTSPYYDLPSWGNHFDFSSRVGKLPAHEPIIVWTSLIGQAFLDAYETFRLPRFLEVARGIRQWILALPREQTHAGTCISYVAFEQRSIHNANMLGAAFLARTGALDNDQEALRVARQAMLYSCSRQLPDGSWYYGEEPKYHWIDSFHTGYNLDSLHSYLHYTGDEEFSETLARGFHYFRTVLFEDDGTPRYFSNSTYPVDIQCASQGIETLTKLSTLDGAGLEPAVRVALWTIRNMQDADGHFYFRRLRRATIKTPMLHWGQATMYKALTGLLGALSSQPAQREATHVSQGRPR